MGKEFIPLNNESPEPQKETAAKSENKDDVQKALDTQKIAEANLKTRLAEQGVKDFDQFKEKARKLDEAKADFEKQKSAWLEKWEQHKAEEIVKIQKVKAYWESKAQPVKEAENELEARTNRVKERETAVKSREESVELRIENLESTVKLKESQIKELKDIIEDKAPRYHKLFKHMMSEGESRRNWNYNAARADQWHNFTERVRIIVESLHRMLFGDV